jgi:hypothetical protein
MYKRKRISKEAIKLNMYKPTGEYCFEKIDVYTYKIHLTAKDASNLANSLSNFDVEVSTEKGYYGTVLIVRSRIETNKTNSKSLLLKHGFRPSTTPNEFIKNRSYEAILWDNGFVTINIYTIAKKRLIDATTYKTHSIITKYLEANHY